MKMNNTNYIKRIISEEEDEINNLIKEYSPKTMKNLNDLLINKAGIVAIFEPQKEHLNAMNNEIAPYKFSMIHNMCIQRVHTSFDNPCGGGLYEIVVPIIFSISFTNNKSNFFKKFWNWNISNVSVSIELINNLWNVRKVGIFYGMHNINLCSEIGYGYDSFKLSYDYYDDRYVSEKDIYPDFWNLGY